MNRKKVMIIAGVVLLVAAALAVYYAWSAHRARYDYAGTVETREIQIGSKVGGRVIAVPFEEGAQVKAGALLVRFEADDLKAQRAQAAAAVDQAQANLDRLIRGNRPEEIAQAEDAAAKQPRRPRRSTKWAPQAGYRPGPGRLRRRPSRRPQRRNLL